MGVKNEGRCGRIEEGVGSVVVLGKETIEYRQQKEQWKDGKHNLSVEEHTESEKKVT